MNYEFHGIGCNRPQQFWEIARHSHSFNEVIVISSGAEEIRIGDAPPVVYSAGSIFVLRPHVPHSERMVPEFGLLDTFFLAVKEELPAEIVPVLNDSQGRVRILCSWLESQRDARDPFILQQNDVFLQAIVSELLWLALQREKPLVTRIHTLVRYDLGFPWTLEILAEKVQMSKFHFARRYKQEAGITPMEDLRRIRINAVRDCLLTTRFPLKMIAGKCGFSSEVSLSRVFQQFFNCTPGSLRK